MTPHADSPPTVSERLARLEQANVRLRRLLAGAAVGGVALVASAFAASRQQQAADRIVLRAAPGSPSSVVFQASRDGGLLISLRDSAAAPRAALRFSPAAELELLDSLGRRVIALGGPRVRPAGPSHR